MPIRPKQPVSHEEIGDIVQEQVQEILEQMGVVLSTPASGEKRVSSIYVVYVDGNPRLQVEYDTEE